MNDPVRRVVTHIRTLVPDHSFLIARSVGTTADSFVGDGDLPVVRGAKGPVSVRVHDRESTEVALRMATAIVRPPSPPERCS